MQPTAPANALLRRLALAGVLAIALSVTQLACAAPDSGATTGGGANAAAAAGGAEVVAEIAGQPVTMSELEEAAAPQLKQLEAQRRKILEGALDSLVEEKLLAAEAAARGVSTEELLASEATAPEVTDADVDAWYEENKARLGNRTKESVAEQIKRFLEQQRAGEAQSELMASLREKHAVRILLEPERMEVEVADAPTKGPDSAPVTIVEFSDFECPFCSRVNPTLAQVRETYGDQVRIAFRQFPLAMHPNAPKAAEASLCAHEQGRFWDMHDKLFANQRALTVDDLKGYASELELDTGQFNACLDGAEYAEQVAADMADGQAAGVTGTPAMFVNGRLVSGAVPYEQLAAVIDDELARQGGE